MMLALDDVHKEAGMSIVVGMDLVAIERMRESVTSFGDRFLGRVFTPGEIAYCTSFAGDAALERMATRAAAKEATIKALRPSARWIDPRSIEVVRSASGAPTLLLHGEARALADSGGITSLSLSMSHEGPIASAIVVGFVQRNKQDTQDRRDEKDKRND